ncbi:MAG: TMEM175 family protein [Ferruginibacter sp.]
MSRKNHHDESHDIFEDRKQFQLERLILFSDAVFAIAITLLVIEIKVPERKELFDYHEFLHLMNEKLVDILSYLLSFAVIGQFWITHHRLFRYVNDYNSRLIWLNLHLLFWIALMPFTTILNMRYGDQNIVWCWYSLNMFFIAFALFLIWIYLFRKPELCTMSHDRRFMRYAVTRTVVTCIIFLAGGFIVFLPGSFFNALGHFFFFLIFPAHGFLNRFYLKKTTVK